MSDRKRLDYEGLKEYDTHIKRYIDQKIKEAIAAYQEYDESNDPNTDFVIDDDTEDITEF